MPNKNHRKNKTRQSHDHESDPPPDFISRVDQALINEAEPKEVERNRQKEKEPTANGAVKKSQRVKNKNRWQTWTPIIISFLLMSVTTVYTFFGYRQLKAMEQALQVRERAYLTINSIDANFQSGQIQITFGNTGQVRADKVVVRVDVVREDVERNNLQASSEPTTPPENITVVEWNSYKFYSEFSPVAPGGMNNVIDVAMKDFKVEDARLIRAGRQRLKLNFWFRYDNGVDHTEPNEFAEGATKTSFSFRYIPGSVDRWETVSLYEQEDIRKQNEEDWQKGRETKQQ